jgi:hypothetical protein
MPRTKATAAELQATGSRRDKVAARERQERQAMLTHIRPATVEVTVPGELTDVECQAIFEHVAKRFKLDPVGHSLLTQALVSLQRAKECSAEIQRRTLRDESTLRPTVKELIGAEKDHRLIYQRFMKELGV